MQFLCFDLKRKNFYFISSIRSGNNVVFILPFLKEG